MKVQIPFALESAAEIMPVCEARPSLSRSVRVLNVVESVLPKCCLPLVVSLAQHQIFFLFFFFRHLLHRGELSALRFIQRSKIKGMISEGRRDANWMNMD